MQTIQLKVTWVSFKLFLSLCYYVLIHVLIFVASDGLWWKTEVFGERAASLEVHRLHEDGIEL